MGFLKNTFFISIICLSPYYVTNSVIEFESSAIKCEFYNNDECLDPLNCTFTLPDEPKNNDSENGRFEQCKPGKVNYCFAQWSNDSFGRITVQKKGCFDTFDRDCPGQTKCIGRRKTANFYYCCCDGDLCNTNFSFEPFLQKKSPKEYESTSETDSVPITVHILVISTCSILIAVLLYSLYSFRKRELCYFNRNLQYDQRSQTDSSSIEKLLPIELLVKKAEGRFGEVWKAMYKPKNELVAVKIVPAQFKSSWSTEVEVLKTLQSGHENILQFYGAEKHYDGSHPKYWLITAYHERGSLCEHLKNNTLSYEQTCSISYTMAKGLDYLHDEIFNKFHECSKPSIAHRDFKSNNVLLKDDFTACVADFGLAIIFRNSQFDDCNHGQVGTRRYMAPEVLQGSITFSIAAFQRIDIYACGLVLWEILSRCTVHEDATGKYKLPFEEELGEHPSIEQMLEVVVNQRKRPEIKESWQNDPLLTDICKTIEDCWEAEPEARVTASLVAERFLRLSTSMVTCEAEAKLLSADD